MKKLIAIIGLLSASASLASAQLVWNFTDLDATFDTGTPLNYTITAISLGNTFGTVATPVNASSASSGYTGATAGGNIGNAVNIGALNTATSAYYQFGVSPASGYAVQINGLDFGTRSTSTGPQAYALRWSADSFATDIFTGTIANNSAWSLKSHTFTAQTAPADTVVTFRLYTYAGTGSAASGTINNRLDDIALTITAVAAVPEPSALPLMACGFALLALRRRRVA